MPRMTGGIKTGRFYVSLPKAAAEEIEEYVKESGMYRACFLSYALTVGTRVVERQRTNVSEAQSALTEVARDGMIAVKPDDFSNASLHDSALARQQQVKMALEQIAPEQRELLELNYFDGLTESQLAERFGLPLASIRARMILAVQHLDALLSESQQPGE